ncbi:hypothetical protein LPJ53_003058 [Coemansia erecta]|uniref:Uncharacterized protein n=1 Tax=Coemansia erecta TaxID=147472 RepID=A0A9W8CQK1_9FUNG|nr:hypothetical protein LPJ53_003058 [Coemansia erecta]
MTKAQVDKKDTAKKDAGKDTKVAKDTKTAKDTKEAKETKPGKKPEQKPAKTGGSKKTKLHPAYVAPPRMVPPECGLSQPQQHRASQHRIVKRRKQLLSWPMESMLALDAWLGRLYSYGWEPCRA